MSYLLQQSGDAMEWYNTKSFSFVIFGFVLLLWKLGFYYNNPKKLYVFPTHVPAFQGLSFINSNISLILILFRYSTSYKMALTYNILKTCSLCENVYGSNQDKIFHIWRTAQNIRSKTSSWCNFILDTHKPILVKAHIHTHKNQHNNLSLCKE